MSYTAYCPLSLSNNFLNHIYPSSSLLKYFIRGKRVSIWWKLIVVETSCWNGKQTPTWMRFYIYVFTNTKSIIGMKSTLYPKYPLTHKMYSKKNLMLSKGIGGDVLLCFGKKKMTWKKIWLLQHNSYFMCHRFHKKTQRCYGWIQWEWKTFSVSSRRSKRIFSIFLSLLALSSKFCERKTTRNKI
jgi:hypothetical protein